MKRQSVRLEWNGKNSDIGRTDFPLQKKIYVHPINSSAKAQPNPANRLILGDNLQVMDALLAQHMGGKFRILYADPPFATGKGFPRRTGMREDSRKPETWKLGAGYSDSWLTLDDYLTMLHARLVRMRELLADNGTLYLHLDWRAAHYARILLDEIFGPENFLNEIIWVYHGPSPVRSYFNRKHDTILAYGKCPSPLFNGDRIRVPYNPSTIRTFRSSVKAGFGKKPDLARGKIPEDWWYFPVVARLHTERTGYPTQKPEALLERIIQASSDPGDWVGDFFCGSGTTLRVAEALSRRWVGCDVLSHAIGVCQRRLFLASASPYSIERLAPDSQKGKQSHRLRLKLYITGRKVTIQLVGMDPCLPSGFPSSVDYWEVDFDFSGDIFCSAFQSARPWRVGTVGTIAHHQYAHAGEYQIAVRSIDSDGNIGIGKRVLVVE